MSVQKEPSSESHPLGGGKPSRYCQAHVIRLLGASLCVATAVASWVVMAEKLQNLNKNYQKSYFLTYWVHSYYTLVYVAWKLWSIFPGGFRCNRVGEGALPFTRKLLFLSGFMALVSMASAYLWYLSLARTNIPANTAIYQSSSVFVYIFSVPLLRERVTVVKVLSIALSVGGVTLVSLFSSNTNCKEYTPLTNSTHNASWSDMEPLTHHVPPSHGGCSTENSTPAGYVFLVISIMLYAVFEVSYKKYGTKKDDPAEVMNGARMLGYFGVHSLFWMWPPIIIFHFTGIETFELPTREILLLMVWNGLLDIVFYVGLLVCIALTSPLFASVGTVLAIPASVIVDWIVQGFLLPPQAFIGIALIVLGFASFTFSEFFNARREAKESSSVVSNSAKCNSGETSPLLNGSKEEIAVELSNLIIFYCCIGLFSFLEFCL